VWRAVVDTNLIVSGTASINSVPYHLLEAWRNNEYVLVTSPSIIAEVHEVLNRPHIRSRFSLTNSQIQDTIQSFETRAFVTVEMLEVNAVKDDPDDDKLIAAALEGSATHIISGDQHLLKLGAYQNIPILTAREFLEKYLKKKV